MHTLVLMRHGETEWSRQNRFAGWSDVGLSPQGEEEARRAGDALAAEDWVFDRCYTSVLTRAGRTLDIVLDRMGAVGLPTVRSWRLNERHYGALQGRNRADAAREFGQEAVYSWRREYTARPPALADDDPRLPHDDALYRGLDFTVLPRTESHKDTVERVVPLWESELAPLVRSGESILVVSHTSSIRGLVKIIEGISDRDIEGFKIATAVPLVYELDSDLKPLSKRYLSTGLAGRARLLVSKIRPRRHSRWLG